jgi:hypothetical protein
MTGTDLSQIRSSLPLRIGGTGAVIRVTHSRDSGIRAEMSTPLCDSDTDTWSMGLLAGLLFPRGLVLKVEGHAQGENESRETKQRQAGYAVGL